MNKRIRMAIRIGVLVILAIMIGLGFYNALSVRRCAVSAGKGAPARIALITDLHSCRYGEEEAELIAAIDVEAPDLILLGGDIFDDRLPNDNAVALLAGLAGRYPCYYVTGNHECWAGEARFAEDMALLERYGVVNLGGRLETVMVNGREINLCGLDDPYAFPGTALAEREAGWLAQLEEIAARDRQGRFTILLSHRPEYFERYTALGFDLVLAGHAHGGQWRVPGLLNGLYAPGQGLFPKYAGGVYERNGTTMIVSRGLARESTRLPRLYNRPELVIVELTE